MDYGKALTFITEDERWKEKLAIGAGVIIVSMVLSMVLIGVLGFFIVAGYCVRLLQNVRDGSPAPLPEWDQWGEDLMRGFKLFVVGFVWALPIIVFAVPIAIGGALTDSSRNAGAFLGSTILLCSTCLMMLYGLFLAVMTPGFSIAFASDETISSGLQLSDIWRWTQENVGQVILAALVYLVASFMITIVAGITGLLLCIIGLIVTVPLGTLVTYLFQYHLYGQLAREFPMAGKTGDHGSARVTTDLGEAGHYTSDVAVVDVTPESDAPLRAEESVETAADAGSSAEGDEMKSR